ncbi:hypothetical protein MUK51_18430 [Sphingobacterium faecium]|uniref:hypothetical protein n=1 Tax=Sphingobacterium faecium TaxID=34087 RepID=UPI0021B667C7|nr:hypothetical protein [Sphingobacterium faecium]UXD69157.1 hypothetical protein MUK51_18430 [Sphingobacterium faecium]
MESTTSWETLEFDGTVEITETVRKYFTPITRQIDASKIITRQGINSEEYLKHRKEELANTRNLKYKLRVQRSHTEQGEVFYHKDYSYRDLSSRVLFKKPEKELSYEEGETLEDFLSNLFSIMALYKEDYWQSYYENYDDFSLNPFIQNAIEEIKDILNVLKMRDDINGSEFVLRHREQQQVKDRVIYQNVIREETTKVNDHYKKEIFDYYAQVKYQNFLHRFELTRFLTTEEEALKIPIKKAPNTILEFDREISLQIGFLEFSNIKPSCTTDFFQLLVDTLVSNMSFDAKLSPLYEFNKFVVPALNNFIQDQAHEIYKKKDKHFLLFSILRLFDLVPQKHSLELTGIDDVKEDFIKQLIRK